MTDLCKRFIAFRIKEEHLPWLYLTVCVIAFGLFIRSLGFFWDDWMTLYFMKTSSHPADFFYAAYRPLFALLDIIEFRILGSSPLGWQILSLILRWGAVVLVWVVMRRVVPSAKEFANWVAILFAIYPSFHQQASAVVYRQHWITYVFFLLSLLFMLISMREKGKHRYWFVFLGLAALLADLLTTEYLVGLELLRPFLIWVVISAKTREWMKRLREVLAIWWPYVLVTVGFMIGRLFLVSLPEDPNPPVLISQLINQPVQGLMNLLRAVLQDLIGILWTPWANSLNPSMVDLSGPATFLIFASIPLLAFVFVFLFNRIKFGKEGSLSRSQLGFFLLLGSIGILAGMATVWIVGRQATVGAFSDRLTIPAMLGASILVAAWFFFLLPDQRHRNLVLAILVSLAISTHFQDANAYRNNWRRQADIAWQFHWRAPSLQPGTLVIGNGALATYLDDYNSAFAINIWYPETVNAKTPTYWFRDFFSGLQIASPDELAQGVHIKALPLGLTFNGNTRRSIIAYSSPASPCWWFLTPADFNNLQIEPEIAAASAYTDINLIGQEGRKSTRSLTEIYGPEPDGGWCEVFQKASLARQVQDWQSVRELWLQADQRDLKPQNGYELLPIIEAYAHSGEWENAKALSFQAYQITKKSRSMICADWKGFAALFGNGPDLTTAFEQVNATLGCP